MAGCTHMRNTCTFTERLVLVRFSAPVHAHAQSKPRHPTWSTCDSCTTPERHCSCMCGRPTPQAPHLIELQQLHHARAALLMHVWKAHSPGTAPD
eukprot:366038-Chlamydomonas_euryale.AAC.1